MLIGSESTVIISDGLTGVEMVRLTFSLFLFSSEEAHKVFTIKRGRSTWILC